MRDIDFNKLSASDLIDHAGIAAAFKDYLVTILFYDEGEADFVVSTDFEDPYDTPYIMQDYICEAEVDGRHYEVRFCYTDFRACGMFHLMYEPPFEFYMFIDLGTLQGGTVGDFQKAKKMYMLQP